MFGLVAWARYAASVGRAERMGWDDSSSDGEASIVADAERCRSSQSDDESSEESVSVRAVWWARRLTEACREAQLSPMPASLPTQYLVSGCTGCCAEVEVFKAT